MPIGITTPHAALNALRVASVDATKASERISTGLRINRASDDPAGQVRANRLSVEIGSYTQVKSNLTSAVSMTEQVGDSLASIAEILSEMKTLALASMSAANDTLRADYQTAFASYLEDIDTIASATTANGSSVLDGSTTSVVIQVGIESTDSKTLTFWNTSTLNSGLNISGLSIETSANATTAYAALDTPLNTVNTRIATVGAYQSSLGYLSDFADSMILNTSTSYGNLMNADLAEEATNLASAEIRQNSSLAMVAQTNSLSKELVDFLLESVID